MEITSPRLYHQIIPREHQQKFDTKHLIQSKDAQIRYNNHTIQEIKSNLHPEINYLQVDFIEIHNQKMPRNPKLVTKKKENSKNISDPEIESQRTKTPETTYREMSEP